MKTWALAFIILLASVVTSFAASTNTVNVSGKGDITIYTIDIIADASTGAVDDTALSICGYITMVTWDPGSPAPTDLLDAYLFEDAVNGVRIMGNRLVDLSAVSAKQVSPNVSNSSYFPRPVCGTVILRVFNTSVASAEMQFKIFVTSSY